MDRETAWQTHCDSMASGCDLEALAEQFYALAYETDPNASAEQRQSLIAHHTQMSRSCEQRARRYRAMGAGDWEGADAEAARAFGGEDEKKGSSQPW
jgi:hypothetical protein